nr:hypothetical protein [Micromonospora sp. DSM 115978]
MTARTLSSPGVSGSAARIWSSVSVTTASAVRRRGIARRKLPRAVGRATQERLALKTRQGRTKPPLGRDAERGDVQSADDAAQVFGRHGAVAAVVVGARLLALGQDLDRAGAVST